MFLKNHDIIGDALIDFFLGNKNAEMILNSQWKINTKCILKSRETIPISVFFQDVNTMLEVDKQAINQCYGKVLDVGAAAGSHSMILEANNLVVYSIDISKGAVWVMRERGLTNVHHRDIKSYDEKMFDTIVFFGGNHGLFGNKNSYIQFLQKAKYMLTTTGQILISSPYIKIPIKNDSTDTFYYSDYTELIMTLQYSDKKGKSFNWFMAHPDYILSLSKRARWFGNAVNFDNNRTCLIRLTQ